MAELHDFDDNLIIDDSLGDDGREYSDVHDMIDLTTPDKATRPGSQATDGLSRIEDSLTVSCRCGNQDESKFSFVSNVCDDVTMRQCDVCGDCRGNENGVSLTQLAGMLESGSLNASPCEFCSNDDMDQFVFEEGEDGVISLKCSLCHHVQGNPIESASVDDIAVAMDTGHEMGLRCQCGNVDPDLFMVHNDRSGRPVLLECHCCEQFLCLDAEHQGRAVAPSCDPLVKRRTPVGRNKVERLSDLKLGDHIAWHHGLAYWHHAIVVKCSDLDPNKLKVIHYNGPVNGLNGIIVEEWIALDFKKADLYQLVYADCDTPDMVLTRARTRLKETKYNLLANNCEHFAMWAKTGIHRSEQVETLRQSARRFGQKVFAKLGKDSVMRAIRVVRDTRSSVTAPQGLLAKTKSWVQWGVGGLMGGKTAGEVAQAEAKAMTSSIARVDWLGVGVVMVIEATSMTMDVVRSRRKVKDGHLSLEEHVNVVVKRVSRGTAGVGGGLAGGMVGQFVVPIPVVGGVVGATLGAAVGEGLGALVGRHLLKCRPTRKVPAAPEDAPHGAVRERDVTGSAGRV